MEETKKKPIVRKSDLILLLICVVILGYIMVNQGGCYMVKRTEKIEWID